MFYVRFMDDILVLAPTRWKLRKAVRVLNQVLSLLGLDKHPEKTFIGRIERGFGILGYHFGTEGLSVARKTLERFVQRATRLYEQEPSRLREYAGVWFRWVCAGVGGCDFRYPVLSLFVCGWWRFLWSARGGAHPGGDYRFSKQ